MHSGTRILAGLAAGLLVLGGAGTAAAQSAAPSGMTGSLAGTDWQLATLGGKPMASGAPIDLVFTDTEVGGSTGCNSLAGPYVSDGVSSLTIGPIATTRIACDAATMQVETDYLTSLAGVASYSIGSDGTLTLSDSTGLALLLYAPTAPATVEGPWIITNVNNGTGGVGPVPDGIGASIAFNPDGTLEGFGGCNNFSSVYTIDGGSITIAPLMSTFMSCGDATDAFEGQLLTALQSATTWSITSGTLDLRDSSGAQQVEATTAIGH